MNQYDSVRFVSRLKRFVFRLSESITVLLLCHSSSLLEPKGQFCFFFRMSRAGCVRYRVETPNLELVELGKMMCVYLSGL